ncbi:MAG: PDDEXK nuclease domain-containing protein [Candidatus Cloacimonetes bacterium]|nr:PDDEXK nuclease domain-containing protein [Candidatus Cloacimonadota bacterium]MDY0173155.1 PDDEXK nuclease domain-containing protein [Candidatus Cloacimonadaceae bacterium]
MNPEMLNTVSFPNLVSQIHELHQQLQTAASKSVNMMLTLRNWLIGYYIAEYELKGSDRAEYGDKVIDCLAKEFQKLNMSRMDKRELYRYLKFYKTYPQIVETVSPQLQRYLGKSLASTLCRPSWLDGIPAIPIVETPSPLLQIDGGQLISSLSFSHISELLEIEDKQQQVFYCLQCIEGNWSVRQLRRQIKSLYFERSLMSRDKDKLITISNHKAEVQNPELFIRDPYVFEFLGLRADDALSESTVEDYLLDKLQDFLLELGDGFCFEARQKRILIGDTQFYVDLVFYHRILKCHILIELKLAEFNHENLGQLNTYVSWYRVNKMLKGDNPPIGILLCTDKDSTLVEYALAGMDNNLFVSEYLLALPSKEEMQTFLASALKQELL